jgi:hypothetical protein
MANKNKNASSELAAQTKKQLQIDSKLQEKKETESSSLTIPAGVEETKKEDDVFASSSSSSSDTSPLPSPRGGYTTTLKNDLHLQDISVMSPAGVDLLMPCLLHLVHGRIYALIGNNGIGS